jgi:hypothetical protein
MATINISIEIEQEMSKEDLDDDQLEEFEEMFFNSDPYLMNDSIPEEFGVDILEEVSVSGKENQEDSFHRTIKAKFTLEVEKWEEFKEFLEEDSTLIDGEFDAGAFARHFMGDWEGVFVDEEMIDIENYSVEGELKASS